MLQVSSDEEASSEEEEENSAAEGNAGGGEGNAGGEGNTAEGDSDQNTDDKGDLRDVFDDPMMAMLWKELLKLRQKHKESIKRWNQRW